MEEVRILKSDLLRHAKLHIAVEKGLAEVVRILLSAPNIEKESMDELGHTAFQRAVDLDYGQMAGGILQLRSLGQILRVEGAPPRVIAPS